jgi:hypothetical protein
MFRVGGGVGRGTTLGLRTEPDNVDTSEALGVVPDETLVAGVPAVFVAKVSSW